MEERITALEKRVAELERQLTEQPNIDKIAQGLVNRLCCVVTESDTPEEKA